MVALLGNKPSLPEGVVIIVPKHPPKALNKILLVFPLAPVAIEASVSSTLGTPTLPLEAEPATPPVVIHESIIAVCLRVLITEVVGPA